MLCVAVNKKTGLDETTERKFWITDQTTDINQRSIALLLISQENEILYYLSGDLGETYEEKIVNWIGKVESIPVIKFSHHGSKNSVYAPQFDYKL